MTRCPVRRPHDPRPAMNTPQILTRRAFASRLSALGVGGALASLTGVPLLMQRALAEGTIGRPAQDGRVKKLLFLFLRGANDGLNSVIPYGDDAYNTTNRPTLYLAADPGQSIGTSGPAYFPASGASLGTYLRAANTPLGGLALGNGFAGLHPSLKFLAPVYNAGDLALVHRVGYPRQSRSHFDSQNYWETGAPRDDMVRDGILYRAMVESGLANTNPLTAVSFQSSLPLLLRGSKAAMTNLSDTSRYSLFGVPNDAAGGGADKAERFLKRAIEAEFADKKSRELLDLQYHNLLNTMEIFASIDFNAQFMDNEATDGDRPYNLFPASNDTNGGWQGRNDANKYVVPTGSYDFFRNLKAAALVLNKTDAIVAGTQIDGFDTHSNQGSATGSHANLLRRIGWAVYGLRKYFLQNPDKCRWDDLVVVTLTEFGRTTVENDDNGTDHAEAGVMFLAGGAVKGYAAGPEGRSGIFGADSRDSLPWQTGQKGSMFQASQRYLQRSYDYRSVMGRLLRNHLGASPAQLNRIIPGYAAAGEALLNGGIQAADGVRIMGEPDIV